MWYFLKIYGKAHTHKGCWINTVCVSTTVTAVLLHHAIKLSSMDSLMNMNSLTSLQRPLIIELPTWWHRPLLCAFEAVSWERERRFSRCPWSQSWWRAYPLRRENNTEARRPFRPTITRRDALITSCLSGLTFHCCLFKLMWWLGGLTQLREMLEICWRLGITFHRACHHDCCSNNAPANVIWASAHSPQMGSPSRRDTAVSAALPASQLCSELHWDTETNGGSGETPAGGNK